MYWRREDVNEGNKGKKYNRLFLISCLLVEVIRALLGAQSNIEEVIYMEF